MCGTRPLGFGFPEGSPAVHGAQRWAASQAGRHLQGMASLNNTALHLLGRSSQFMPALLCAPVAAVLRATACFWSCSKRRATAAWPKAVPGGCAAGPGLCCWPGWPHPWCRVGVLPCLLRAKWHSKLSASCLTLQCMHCNSPAFLLSSAPDVPWQCEASGVVRACHLQRSALSGQTVGHFTGGRCCSGSHDHGCPGAHR